MFDVMKEVLRNGIKVVTVKKDTKIASINIGIKIGSIYESIEEKGISHFIEHMLFKGTKTKSNEELNFNLEQLAGDYNAYTGYDCTVYNTVTLNEELENSIKLLSDMLQNSIFPEKEFQKEKQVIISEIRTSRDDIEDYSYQKAHEEAFYKSDLKYEVIGKEKNIKNFNRRKLINFYNKYYVPNNCYIVVVSSFEHKKLINLINTYFKYWKYKEFNRKLVVKEDNICKTKVSFKKDIEQSTIVYIFTFHNLSKQQELILRILSYKLGESCNSILFKELREKKGLVYDVYTDIDVSKDVKTLYIYTSVNEENVNFAIKIINSCINKIKKQEVIFDKDIINNIKKVFKTNIALTLEDSIGIGNYILSKIIDNEEIYEFLYDIESLDNIKEENIYNIARLVLKNPTIHILKNA